MHTYQKVYLHIIWHVRTDSWKIDPEDKGDLFRVMGTIAKENSYLPIIIGGTDNHVHLLVTMSFAQSVPDVVGKIKRESSAWMSKRNPKYKKFHWQAGYATFSVCASKLEVVKRYIANQEEHHRKHSFKEELIKFLEEYDVEYDERYLFCDS